MIEHKVFDSRKEHFRLIAKNKTLTIESNRPLLPNKRVKHGRYDLKLLDENTEIWNRAFVAKIWRADSKICRNVRGKRDANLT
jgi:hypothetical protein